MKILKTKPEFIDYILQSLTNDSTSERYLEASLERMDADFGDEGFATIYVKVDRKRGEATYLSYYPAILDSERKQLNGLFVVSYLNFRRMNTWFSHDTLVLDAKKKQLGIRMKFFMDLEKVSYRVVRKQVGKVLDAYDSMRDEVECFIFDGDVEDFKSSLHLNWTSEKFEFEGCEECYQNACKAATKYGEKVTRISSTDLFKWPLRKGKLTNSISPLTFSLGMDKRRHGIALMHALPSGFSLEAGVDVAMATAYLNNKLEYGRFDIDLYTGRVYYQFVLDPLGVNASQEIFEKAYEMVIQTLTKYYPIYVYYLKGKLTNKEYILLVEVS